MDKRELIDWLKEEYSQFQALLDEIGPARMELPGVAAHWTTKDIVAHLSGWHPTLIGPMQAALHGEPKPPSPWPAHLQTDDEINAWIYERNRERPLSEILAETHQQIQQLLAILEALPDDARIETVHHGGKDFYLVWIGEERFLAGEFFDHFHDDHEPDIRAWLAKTKTA
ncbi:MAG: ClbS/DfsB family four-helix bundle protein [Anaerolineaceae bacterium]|nr:ClbS/DfsB family four-helix bundle protein [Anaerolineaceae bacterium]